MAGDVQLPATEPLFIPGGMGLDDRGTVLYCNNFNFAGVKRCYVVNNHRQGFVRAWHAHRREAKYVMVMRGSALVGAVKIDQWESPSRELKVHREVLGVHRPGVYFIPAGYANGFMSLTEDATLAFFSTSTVEESKGDDVRYDARYWNIWDVVER